MFEPDTQGTDRVLVMVTERINSASAVNDAGRLVVLTGFLISTDGLGHDFVVLAILDDDASGVTYVYAEQLLAEGHDADACGPREADVHHAREELFVAVEEGVVERDADLVSVQCLVVLLLEQVLVVLLEHEAHLCLDELRQALLHVARHFPPVLTVAVRHREKVAVLEAAEVGHCDPRILVLLVRVGGRLARLGGEGKLSHTVGVHLTGIRGVVGMLLLIGGGLLGLLRLFIV